MGGGVSEEKRALPMEAVQALQQTGASIPYGEYMVLCSVSGTYSGTKISADIRNRPKNQLKECQKDGIHHRKRSL